MKHDNLHIHDRWLFIFVYPVMAVLSLHIGNDNPLKVLLGLPSYYTDLLLAFALTFGLGFYFRRVFRWMDINLGWQKNIRKRFIYHIGLGVFVPVITVVGIEIIYLTMLRIPVTDSSVFYLEMPVAALFCVLVNLIYLQLYYHSHTQKITAKINKSTPEIPVVNFVVKTGSQTLNIPENQVAYFAILEKYTFLVSTEGKQYLYDLPLEKIREKVSTQAFFQLNRQVLAQRNCIRKFHQTETRRLLIELNPPLSYPVYVAKTKVAKFNQWLGQS